MYRDLVRVTALLAFVPGILLGSAQSAPLPQGVLRGRIVDWPSGQTAELRLAVNSQSALPVGQVDAQGNFKVQLPKLTNDSLPWTELLKAPPPCTGSFKLDPAKSEHRGFYTHVLLVYQNNQRVADVQWRNTAALYATPGAQLVSLVYSTGQISFSSTITCPRPLSVKRTVEVKLATGWNVMVTRTTMNANGGMTLSTVNAPTSFTMGWRLFDEAGFIGTLIELDPTTNTYRITTVVEGSPAQAAGIQVGDVILAVDGFDSTRIPPWAITDVMTGEPGSVVKLTLLRGGKRVESSVSRVVYRVP